MNNCGEYSVQPGVRRLGNTGLEQKERGRKAQGSWLPGAGHAELQPIGRQ